MTKEQLNGLRTRIEADLDHLEQRTGAVRRELLQTGEALPTVIRNGLDHAKDETDLNARLELNERDRGLLARPRVALGKIIEGSYGNCEKCDEPIEHRRLETHPTAHLCIICQSRSERFDSESSARQPARTLLGLSYGPVRYTTA